MKLEEYTARIIFTRNGIGQEDVWFEHIRAADDIKAQNLAAVKAGQYIQQHRNGVHGPTGYNVVFCMLTSVVDGGFDSVKEKQALMTPNDHPPPKVKVISIQNKLDEKKFKDEVKGDFADPFIFKEAVSIVIPNKRYYAYSDRRF